jgi:hypothetical protein
MSSIKKTTSVIITAIIIAGIAFSLTDQLDSDNSVILDQIKFDAVYLESENIVKISFDDKSKNTKSVILEILGMDVTYHKEYIFDNKSSFIEIIYLEKIPKYGWKTTPVTLEIYHSQFGKIGLKTEIHEKGDSIPKIIIEQK